MCFIKLQYVVNSHELCCKLKAKQCLSKELHVDHVLYVYCMFSKYIISFSLQVHKTLVLIY